MKKHPALIGHFPTYSDEELDILAHSYWSTSLEDAKAPEGLIRAAWVVRRLTIEPIAATATKSWQLQS